jgi:uncharacterized protein YpmS
MIDFIKRKPMRTFWILIFIIVLALLIIANNADVIHADTFTGKPAAKATCYILAKESTRTWRYGTAASQTRNEIRRTIARGIPFGYRKVDGNCTPPVRIN